MLNFWIAVSFLTLPLELRLKVYQHLVFEEDGIELNPLHRNLRATIQRNSALHLAILLTCHTIYDEASTILHEKNTFYLTNGSATGITNHDNSEIFINWPFDFILILTSSNMNRIKHLEINIIQFNDMPTARANYRMLSFLLNLQCRLKTLHINIVLTKPWWVDRPWLAALWNSGKGCYRVSEEQCAKAGIRGHPNVLKCLSGLKPEQNSKLRFFSKISLDVDEFGELMDSAAADANWPWEWSEQQDTGYPTTRNTQFLSAMCSIHHQWDLQQAFTRVWIRQPKIKVRNRI